MTDSDHRPAEGTKPPLAGQHLSWPVDVVVHPDHSLKEALSRMSQSSRAFAPVIDGDAVVGVLSVARLAGVRGHDRDDTTVHDVMLSTVPFLYDDDPLALGASIAEQTEIDHFCVVDHDHLLLGVVAFSGPGRVMPEGAGRPAPVDAHTIRQRLAVTPGRAVDTAQGAPTTYAAGPTLFVDGRETHEPRDRPDPTRRRLRDEAMKSKI